MVKNKDKEYIISNYILQNSDLLFDKCISDIKVIEKGKIVELQLYYKPSSKYDVWRIKKEFYKEPQYIKTIMKNGMICGIFYSPSKYADLIICKLHTIDTSLKEYKILNNETKNPGRSR